MCVLCLFIVKSISFAVIYSEEVHKNPGFKLRQLFLNLMAWPHPRTYMLTITPCSTQSTYYSIPVLTNDYKEPACTHCYKNYCKNLLISHSNPRQIFNIILLYTNYYSELIICILYLNTWKLSLPNDFSVY